MSIPRALPGLVAVMPALDEEESIGTVIAGLHAAGVPQVIVADNGSRDRTAEVARAAGATVVPARRRGYGSACQAALAAVPAETRAVLFCDADGADDLRMVSALASPVLSGEADVTIGSRTLGRAERGALTPPQLMGNLIAAAFIRLLYRVRVTDLGPFRCVSTAALERLRMSDPAYGWTAELQVKALRLGLEMHEIPVDAHCRIAGVSKISGRIGPVFRAGKAILTTIWRYHREDLAGAQPRRPSASRQRSRHLIQPPAQVHLAMRNGATLCN